MEKMENIILSALNFSKVCRVCLMECDSMFSIFSELFEDNSDEKIPTIYEILVQSDDGLPTMICTKCIDKAHSSYKFQQQCDRSQTLLEAYIEQIKDLAMIEDVSISITAENMEDQDYNLKSEGLESVNNDVNENDILPSDLVLSKEEIDLIKNEMGDTEDCESLKNCLPLGEDTVDQLIKDNLQIDNLELISPKIRSFSLNFKTSDDTENTNNVPNTEKTTKEVPNLSYYRKERDDKYVQYECNVCQKTFKFAYSLKIHLKNHDEEKPYVCNECKKGFKVYGSLIHHIRSHSGEQPYECKVCGKRYKQSGTLTAHMRIHTGCKPFLCSICGRGFRQAPDLTYHMRTHTKEKPYMCNVCGKTMSMQCHLVQHMRSHTGEKPFKCFECDKAFPSSTRLKRHSITHTSLKPYKCHICDKSFNRSSSLRVHTKTHLGVRSHVCSICDKAFLWAHSLRGHLLTHSKKSAEKQDDAKEQVAPTTAPPVTNSTSTTALEESMIEFNTMSIFSDEAVDKATNDSFTIYSGTTTDGNSSSNTYQIYALGTKGDQGEVETFTLYSVDPVEENSSIDSSTIQLSAVSL